MNKTFFEVFVSLPICGAWWPGSALENHLRDRLLFRVRDRQCYVPDPESGCELTRLAVELHRRTSAGHSHDFAIAPAHAVVPSSAERFHRRLFRGESSGIALHPVRFRVAVAHFGLSEDSLEKSQSETLDGLADTRYFRDIDSGSDDHAFASYSKRSPR